MAACSWRHVHGSMFMAAWHENVLESCQGGGSRRRGLRGERSSHRVPTSQTAAAPFRRFAHPQKPSQIAAFKPFFKPPTPREINQLLPYGLLSDKEMLDLPFGQLQDCGVMFLWVTGGAGRGGTFKTV